MMYYQPQPEGMNSMAEQLMTNSKENISNLVNTSYDLTSAA